MEIHPNLNPITSRHSYEISYKYMYECTVCDCRYIIYLILLYKAISITVGPLYSKNTLQLAGP